MEQEKELWKMKIKLHSYSFRVDALTEALDDRQKEVYSEALQRSKVEYINRHQEKLDEELLSLVDRFFQ